MSNNLGQNDGNNIQKPYEPDVIKGLTASNAPTKPIAPPPLHQKRKNLMDNN
jgi:hypothetical protein